MLMPWEQIRTKARNTRTELTTTETLRANGTAFTESQEIDDIEMTALSAPSTKMVKREGND